MVFIDYRDYIRQDAQSLEAKYLAFLYAMPMSPTRVFFEETCLASKDKMPFDLLKKKLMLRLNTLGVGIKKIYKEESSPANSESTRKSNDSFKEKSEVEEANNVAPKENSKIHLQRHLDTRKALLRKEQAMAYARAIVAGFEI